jgi:hypothetical protein
MVSTYVMAAITSRRLIATTSSILPPFQISTPQKAGTTASVTVIAAARTCMRRKMQQMTVSPTYSTVCPSPVIWFACCCTSY